MPTAEDELLGTNADGTRNTKYCKYCYENGGFTSDCTMEGMVEICVPHMVSCGMDEETARKMLGDALPALERWAS